MEVMVEFTNVSLALPESKDKAVDNFLSIPHTNGMSSSSVGFVVPMGSPRYVNGSDPTVQPKFWAMIEACCKSRLMGINVDLWKFIFRPTESA